ncbi:hypothetical protein TVAG_079900 [Trichomonas vaginalis G3]|uniref:Right handed beta helix domain-containing protein n=1 Tax=Trichomonas vaginalis (strain ATCC PRA-98 / G3) TaxID=412133 RepID=A2GUD0_TRIV3|nr:hypothetical protein TVAG_079900 [Trichomonas vaginalis G3]|eukprot:XP_001292167.1 hypothetical protein [Trichomonas vaginalis G3]
MNFCLLHCQLFSWKAIGITHKDNVPKDVWNLYFESENTKITKNRINPDISLSNDELFLFKCMFRGYITSGISFSKNNTKIMHSECFFESCSSNIGAAVYIENCDCSIVQHRFCSHNCTASVQGQHSRCFMKTESTECLNYIDESSACECGKSSGYSLFSHAYGKIRFSSINVSKNIGSFNVALNTRSQNFENLNYSTIESNNASSYRMIGLGNGYTYNFENCNILNNFQESSNFGVIGLEGQLTLNGCSILGDHGKGKIFYINKNSNVTVKNSFYDELTTNDIGCPKVRLAQRSI